MSIEYKELSRTPLSVSVDAVFSEVYRDGTLVGHNLNKWIDAPDFKGFARGVFVPRHRLEDFLHLFDPVSKEV